MSSARLAAPLLTLAIVAAGCGGSGENAAPSPTASTAPPATTGPPTPAPAPSEETVVSSPDGSVSLHLPAGSLPPGVTPSDLSVADVTASVTGDDAPAVLIRMEPDGLVLEKPASLVVEAPVLDAEAYVAVHVSSDAVELVPVDVTEDEKLMISVGHFSSMAIAAIEAALRAEIDALEVSTGDRHTFAVGETFIVTHFHDLPDAITVRVSPGEVARITNIQGAAPFADAFYMYDPSVLRFLAEHEFDEGTPWADLVAGAAFAQLLVDYLSSLPRGERGEIIEEFVCLTAAETRIAAGAVLRLTYDWEVRDGNGNLLSFGDGTEGSAYAAGTAPVTCVHQIDAGDPSRTDDPPDDPDDATEEVSFNIDGTDCNTKFHVHWDEIGATGTGETTCTRDVAGIGMAMAFRCGDGQAIEFFEGFKTDIDRLLLEGAVENPPDCRIEAQVGVPGQDLTVIEGNVDRTIRDGPVERMVIENVGG